MATVKREYLIQQHGKDYILYAGLLDAAHSAGLVSIETELIQIPNETNGMVAICRAVVRLVDHAGVTRMFTAIGDADQTNVNRSITKHLVRMAETRSKARALRDAINVAEAPLEDAVGEGDELQLPDPPATAPAPTKPTPTPQPAREDHDATYSARHSNGSESARVMTAARPEPRRLSRQELLDYYTKLVELAKRVGEDYTAPEKLAHLTQGQLLEIGTELKTRITARRSKAQALGH